MGHLKFFTTYSSEAFIDWLSNPRNEYSGIFGVLANSSKITFSADSEPFVPSLETMPLIGMDYMGNEDMDYQYQQQQSVTKQQIVERLHMYYSNLILQKNRVANAVPLNLQSNPKVSEKNLLLDMDMQDELASIALGFKKDSKKISHTNSEISIRYT